MKRNERAERWGVEVKVVQEKVGDEMEEERDEMELGPGFLIDMLQCYFSLPLLWNVCCGAVSPFRACAIY